MSISLKQYLQLNKRVLLVGPPGIAKTSRFIADAKAVGFEEIVIFRASLCERFDIGGALIPDLQQGITRSLPNETLHYLKHTKKRVLLLLDDLGQGPIDVQAALMKLFDDGELPPNVLIGGATNRPGDKAGVTALCEPLRSRFHLAFRIPTPGDGKDDPNGGVPIGTWEQEVENWCAWAMDQGAAPEIIAWHRATNGRTLYQWKPHADPSVRMADFRSWATVIDLYGAGIRDLNSIGAAVGRPIAAEFLAFAALADKLPSPDQVWMDPQGAPVPQEPQALFLVSAFLGAAAQAQHARSLVTYLSRLPRVYGALLARDANRRLGAKLSGTKEWVAWWTANQALFAVGSA